MFNWIFDLDDTIQPSPPFTKGYYDFYNNIKIDTNLQKLLHELNGDKYIFTNATLSHANNVLNKKGIYQEFNSIIDRNIMNTLKPNVDAFLTFIHLSKINKHKINVFFEDSLPNLITAKKFGWITVLISPNSVRHNAVDFNFRTIHQALYYFLN